MRVTLSLPSYRDQAPCLPIWKRVSKNWQTLLMGSGVVFCVVAIAVCFFAHLPLAAAGFGLAALVYAFGAYHMSTQDTTAQKLAKQAGIFKKQVHVFKDENKTLQASNRDLKRISGELETTNQGLRMTKEQLGQKVKQLEESTQKLYLGLKTFNEENLEFKESLHGLDATAEGLEETKEHLNGSLTELEREIAALRALWNELKGYLQAIKEGKLGEQIQQLESLVRQSREANKELTAIHMDYAATEGQLKIIQNTLAEEVLRLQKVREGMDKSIGTLSTATSTINSSANVLQAAVEANRNQSMEV